MTFPHSRAGFALPLVLAVIALGGMLVTASFLLGRLESQSGENGLRAARAFEAAEAGLASTLAQWNPALDTLPVGGRATLGSVGVATVSWQSTIQRLGQDLFSVRSEGLLAIPGASWQARRQLRLLLRWAASLPGAAALTVTDSVTWDGAGSANGYSPAAPGWPSCVQDSVPALRVAPATTLALVGCPGSSCLRGTPPVLIDTTITSGSFSSALTPVVYGSLAGLASRSPIAAVSAPGPTVTGLPPACDWSDPSNWGEPDHSIGNPCTGLMPVIHASGDLRVIGGRGQGVLLVDGDLVVEDGFDFSGLVVVKGRFTSGAGGAHITGAVATGSLAVLPSQRLDVDYSACVLRKVLRGPTQATPLQYRSWAQLY